MTGKESGHIDHEAAQAVPHANPDTLEVAPEPPTKNLKAGSRNSPPTKKSASPSKKHSTTAAT